MLQQALLTITTLARLAQVSKQSAYNHLKRGTIKPVAETLTGTPLFDEAAATQLRRAVHAGTMASAEQKMHL
jgi:predicted site-specific integrase-resolvase